CRVGLVDEVLHGLYALVSGLDLFEQVECCAAFVECGLSPFVPLGLGLPCPFAVDDDGPATDRGLGLGTGSAMLSSGECFPCGVTLDTGGPLVPGARQVVLLLIGQVSDLRGGEHLPLGLSDRLVLIGAHRCLLSRTRRHGVPATRLRSSLPTCSRQTRPRSRPGTRTPTRP